MGKQAIHYRVSFKILFYVGTYKISRNAESEVLYQLNSDLKRDEPIDTKTIEISLMWILTLIFLLQIYRRIRRNKHSLS
jgi:hypothetical protein